MQEHIFQLPEVTEVHCSHVQIRREIHGDENVHAVDLSFWIEGGNELLDLLDPELRTTLYCNRAAAAGQENLPEVLAVLPDRRLRGLVEKQLWRKGDRLKGYRMVIDYGLGDEKSNMDLQDCTVAKQWFEHKQGGTVKVGWTVQYAGQALDSVTTRGKLTGLTDQKAFVQLIASPTLQLLKAKPGRPKGAGADGEPDGQGELEEEEEDGAGSDGDATETFLQQHGDSAVH